MKRMTKQHIRFDNLNEAIQDAAVHMGGFIVYGHGHWDWFSLTWTQEEIKNFVKGEYRISPWGSLEPQTDPFWASAGIVEIKQ